MSGQRSGHSGYHQLLACISQKPEDFMTMGTFLSAGLSFHVLPKGFTPFFIYVFQVDFKAISTSSLLGPACTAPFEAMEPIFQLPVPL